MVANAKASQKQESVKAAIRHFILTVSLPGEQPDNVRDDTPLQSSGILDSMATMGLAEFIERQFGVELLASDLMPERFDCIDHIADAVGRKRAA